jgi:hypothetical protein
MGEMAELPDKFSSFTMTQLNELLEDDEKLNDIVKEMDEVSSHCVSLALAIPSNANQNQNI